MMPTSAWAEEADFADLPDADSDDSAGQAPLSIALKILLLTLFLPEAFSFFVFGLRLTFTRVICLFLAPMLTARFIAKIASGNYRFVASDLFVPLSGIWMILGPAVMNGLSDTLVHSGPDVLEYVIPYMATRLLLSSRGQSIAFVELLCLVIAFVAADALLDTLTGHYFTRDLAGQLAGFYKDWNVNDEFRFGLLRAAGPIEHPILFGFICAIGFLISLTVRIRRRKILTLMCGLGIIISFSSAPQQSLLLGIALLAYRRVFTNVRNRWILLSIPPIIGASILFSSTSTPFGHLFDYLTIDPQTAYYRLYIWRMVGPAVLQSPYFGILQGSTDYQGTVDSLWLVLSMVYGIPCAILTGLSLIGCCSLTTSSPPARLSKTEAALGTTLGIIMFLVIYMGFTVYLWASTWILVGLLVGVRAHLGELGHLDADDDLGAALPA